ncbi:hypothetical protein CHS0354_023616 [Potamilus streckersoni]|uniref:Uncharacterized protein n=1 Tax=Potamilus streckersoni TaxID=2493646 RepID=A0AAE0VTY0_9BIVA|nr:hypothetical protein CHS0354_023616 [Potamilus streckersoni]
MHPTIIAHSPGLIPEYICCHRKKMRRKPDRWETLPGLIIITNEYGVQEENSYHNTILTQPSNVLAEERTTQERGSFTRTPTPKHPFHGEQTNASHLLCQQER